MSGLLLFLTVSIASSSPFLYVSNFGNGYISTYDSKGVLLNAQFANTAGSPQGISFGPDKNLYVSDAGRNVVFQFSGMNGTLFKTFASGANLTGPNAIAWGPDGNLYVSNNGQNTIVRFDGASGQFKDVFVPNIGSPRGLIWGSDGNLYVAGNTPPQVMRYDDKGNSLGVFTNYSGLQTPQGLAFGSDSNLYVADATAETIMRFKGTDGTYINDFVPIGHGLGRPIGLILGTDGNFYVGDASSNAIFRVTSSGAVAVFTNNVSGPTWLCMGANFTESLGIKALSNLWISSVLLIGVSLFINF